MKHSYKATSRAFAALFAFVFTMSSVAQIEEIVVTARKKAENLQDIPVQVDVIGSEKLKELALPVWKMSQRCLLQWFLIMASLSKIQELP